jgi:hypothetical protein
MSGQPAPAPFEGACAICKNITGVVPTPLLLRADDRIEVGQTHQYLGRMKAAQSGTDLLIEWVAIDSSAFRTHSADQANRLHFSLLALHNISVLSGIVAARPRNPVA